ncbi:hypothetical protein ARTHRO9AX_220409 [Arthrobacter sp. 9AX]|nr:hypothetical protein ARTHRO9AX_220409 [Arthrobacter sp. 9AX]
MDHAPGTRRTPHPDCWRFTADDGGTRAVWKYTFSCRPALLRSVMERIGAWLLGRQIEKRIEAFARACEDPALVAGFRALAPGSTDSKQP